MIPISHATDHTQLSMIADKVKQYQTEILGEQQSEKYSVMIPLVQTAEGGLAVLFEERAHTLRRQAGEICFPGGQCEQGDKTFWDTSRRETSEELQIPLERIRYLCSLDTLVLHSPVMLHAFVGVLEGDDAIVPAPSEVERVFTIPLDQLLAMQPDQFVVQRKLDLPNDYPFHLIPNGENYQWREEKETHYFYQHEGTTIWGLTAKILHHFLEIIRG